MSRRELAEAANAYLWKVHRHRENMTEHDIGRYERGEVRWPRLWRRVGLREVLGAASDIELGFYPNRRNTSEPTLSRGPARSEPHAALTSAGVAQSTASTTLLQDQWAVLGVGDAGGEVNRRDVLIRGGVIAVNAVLPDSGQEIAGAGADLLAGVAEALTGGGSQAWSTHPSDVADEDVLAAAAAEMKHGYQAGRYVEVAKALPRLLRTVDASDERSGPHHLHVVAAEVFQTACSVLLKLGEGALAMLAADRSMAAARRSGDPIRIAASARALAHALANSGHHGLATSVALATARQIEPSGAATMDGLAVYGALMLRASVIAATGEDRGTALDALAEAAETARRIRGGDNTYWTYFCSTNVQLHEVSVAVNLGDAGQAIEHARRVDSGLISLPERRACFYVDVARAYLQWGKYDQAYEAICVAEQAAPEEIAVRPQVQDVVGELHQRSPSRLHGQIMELAHRIRAPR